MSMNKIETLAAELVALNVTELIEFKKHLKEKYGLEETVAVAAAPIVEVEKVEEKTSFDVILKSVPAEIGNKLGVIKELNKVNPIGLQPTKAIVESAPVKLLENVSRSEAESLKNVLAQFNADIEII
jgi:ribosomal protein L7/L12